MQDIIGMDISKDRLNAFRLLDRQHNAFGNDKAGFKALLTWIVGAEGLRIVYEPTGPCHRGMEAAKAGHALVKGNPRQARRFAEGRGTQAKADRGDAMLLARMGLALDLPPRPVGDELLNALRELHVARLALIKSDCRKEPHGHCGDRRDPPPGEGAAGHHREAVRQDRQKPSPP
jgi:transposase